MDEVTLGYFIFGVFIAEVYLYMVRKGLQTVAPEENIGVTYLYIIVLAGVMIIPYVIKRISEEVKR